MSTIRDVARIAAVSTATVSRVINSPEVVSPETRNRVAKAMKACRYQYNALAAALSPNNPTPLGSLSLYHQSDFAESIRGVQDFAHREGYQALLGNSIMNTPRRLGSARFFAKDKSRG
jgi:DNA-binding LacI/PurR family transcriptional regulator